MKWLLVVVLAAAGLLAGATPRARAEDSLHYKIPAPTTPIDDEVNEPEPEASETSPPTTRIKIKTQPESAAPENEEEKDVEEAPKVSAPTTRIKIKTQPSESAPEASETPPPSTQIKLKMQPERASPENDEEKDLEETQVPPKESLDKRTFKLTNPAPSPSPDVPEGEDVIQPQVPNVPAKGSAPMKFKAPKKVVEPEPEIDYEDHPIQPAKEVILEYKYPHISKFVTYRPGYFSLDQTLVSGTALTPTFNYSAYAPIAVSFGALLNFNSQWGLDTTVSVAVFRATANQLAFFTLNASSTTIVTAVVSPYYCFHPSGTFSLKVCPGAGIGVDSFPILQFDTATSLSLHSYADMIFRGSVKVEYPISRGSTLIFSTGYDKGMLNTDTIGIQTTSHNTVWGWIGVDNVLSPAMSYFVNFRVERKNTDFQQAPDGWTATSTLYTLGTGISF